MVRHTLKILQHVRQNFESVSDHFGALCIKCLTLSVPTSQNCQTHSNNSSAAADELFESVWSFYGVGV